jgi:ribose 5-phosphate isomerase B
MKIAVACDHAGYKLKEAVKDRLIGLGHEVLDFGTNDENSVDYSDYGRPAAEAVANGEAEMAVLVCGAGIGMSIVANRIKGVRAALCSEPFSAHMSRAHNNANVLVMGGRMVGVEMAFRILQEFLDTEFEGGRHQRRVEKMDF